MYSHLLSLNSTTMANNVLITEIERVQIYYKVYGRICFVSSPFDSIVLMQSHVVHTLRIITNSDTDCLVFVFQPMRVASLRVNANDLEFM